MTFAPTEVCFAPHGDSSIIGRFNEKGEGNMFEYSENREDFYKSYPHKVWVTTPWHMDSGWRFANVKKTVAYILTNDENGEDVVEKWYIKKNVKYTPPSINGSFRKRHF